MLLQMLIQWYCELTVRYQHVSAIDYNGNVSYKYVDGEMHCEKEI